MKKVSQEFVDNLFNNISSSLFRLECLQDYSAEDGFDTVENFIKTNNLGFRVSANPFWKKIKQLNKNNVETKRVRVVKYPINNYTKFELAFYKQATKFSGEKIYLIDYKDFVKLQVPRKDFWIINTKSVIVGSYGRHGKLKQWSLVENKNEIKEFVKYQQLILGFNKLETT